MAIHAIRRARRRSSALPKTESKEMRRYERGLLLSFFVGLGIATSVAERKGEGCHPWSSANEKRSCTRSPIVGQASLSMFVVTPSIPGVELLIPRTERSVSRRVMEGNRIPGVPGGANGNGIGMSWTSVDTLCKSDVASKSLFLSVVLINSPVASSFKGGGLEDARGMCPPYGSEDVFAIGKLVDPCLPEIPLLGAYGAMKVAFSFLSFLWCSTTSCLTKAFVGSSAVAIPPWVTYVDLMSTSASGFQSGLYSLDEAGRGVVYCGRAWRGLCRRDCFASVDNDALKMVHEGVFVARPEAQGRIRLKRAETGRDWNAYVDR